MSAIFPFLLAILIFGIVFIYAAKKVVASILSGGIATFLSLIVLFAIINFLPLIAESTIGISLTWKLTVIIAATFAFFAYLISRLIAGSIVKAFFDPDGWFNGMANGFFGGVISLFPSLVVVLFLFVCVRVAGTYEELNYVRSLSHPGIEQSKMEFPDWPLSTHWRDNLERIPLFSSIFDSIEPFSRRKNRNLAALVTMKRSGYINSFLSNQTGVGPLINLLEVDRLCGEKSVSKALARGDSLGLVFAPVLQNAASSSDLKSDLQKLEIRKLVSDIIASLPKN